MPNGIFTLKQQVDGLRQGAWTNQKTPFVNYLVVAGGGSTGGYGGGGAGGLLQGVLGVSSGSAITATVGAGGAAGGGNGSNSVFGAITANGGGSSSTAGSGNGNSDGGRGVQGTRGQGNSGGNAMYAPTYYLASGGGGAGTQGLPSISSPGAGGQGIASDISGTRTAYAGGGGGGQAFAGDYNTPGGAGGGGAAGGPANSYVAQSGSANTGGGAGGTSYAPGSGAGNPAGGSGIVAISYPDVYAAAASTTGSPTVSTSGSGSLFFDGTGDYLTVPDNSAWAFGSGNFTLEAWVYRTVGGANQIIVIQSDNASAAGSAWSLYITSANKLRSYVYYGSSFIELTSTADVPANTWTHIALVRTSGTVSQYIGGSRDGTSASLSTNSLNDVAQTVGIGATNAGNDRLTGYISNVRIIKGVGPYDATLSTLTVPATPLTVIANTQFLLGTVSGSQFADSSTNSFIVSRNGDVAWNQLSPFATGLGFKNRVYTWTSSGSITF